MAKKNSAARGTCILQYRANRRPLHRAAQPSTHHPYSWDSRRFRAPSTALLDAEGGTTTERSGGGKAPEATGCGHSADNHDGGDPTLFLDRYDGDGAHNL